MRYTKVVIIGGGFAGINTAIHLKRADMDLTLIDKKNHHLFQPLLYQVATAALSPADIATPLREVFRNQDNASVIMGIVTAIDKKKKRITLSNGEEVAFDYLVIGVGARHSYFGNDHWEPIAPGLKTIIDALSLREKILMSFEKAERLDSFQEAEKYLNFVIIGAGPTGVEMAGAIAEIAYKTMFKNFRRIRPEKSKIFLVEGAPRVLPPFPPDLSKRAKKDLEQLGVKVITNKIVTNVTEDGVEMGDEFIACKNVIWAAGNQASPLLKTLDTPLDRQGRAIVEPDLSIPDHPNIFVIGDAACVNDKKGRPIPAIAPAAIQEGRYVAKIIKNEIPKSRRRPFKYFDKGCLATIGKYKAVGFMRKMRFKGLFAWAVWGFIHVFYLVGYRNRFSVMLEWFFHYLSGIRGARVIHHTIDDSLPRMSKEKRG